MNDHFAAAEPRLHCVTDSSLHSMRTIIQRCVACPRSAKLHGHPAKHRVRGVWSTTRQYLRESRKDNRRVMTGDRATRFGNLASESRGKEAPTLTKQTLSTEIFDPLSVGESGSSPLFTGRPFCPKKVSDDITPRDSRS